MKIIKDYPPNYEEITKTFTLHEGIIFTYGDTIYNPDDGPIDELLIAHEETHQKQQLAWGIERWWAKYLENKEFRTNQELMAYRVQYREAKRILKDRERLFLYLRKMAVSLSGEMYGNLMSLEEATQAIKK